jgi:hypothetical protein
MKIAVRINGMAKSRILTVLLPPSTPDGTWAEKRARNWLASGDTN